MKRTWTKIAAVAAAAGLAPLLGTAAAQADPGPVHFSTGSFQCAIYDDGTVGCDTDGTMQLNYQNVPGLIPVNEVVIDQSWLPAHPTFDPATPYTLPGGNPALSEVKTGDGQWGPYIEHAGSRCEVGFHGSFTCHAKGQAFSMYSRVITA